MSNQKGVWNNIRFQAQQLLTKILNPVFSDVYSFIFPQSLRVYSPWNENSFKRDIYQKVERSTLLTKDRVYILDSLTKYALSLDGDLAECGVYKGGGAWIIANAITNLTGGSEKKLYLFDTFKGMPDTTGADAQVHSRGDFGDVSLADVKNVLHGFDNIIYREGMIPETFSGLDAVRFCFVHIDVDLYQSTLDCLRFIYPRLVAGGVVLFDDYGLRLYQHAEKKAVDEFFFDKKEKPISLTNGQTIIIKSP